MGIIGKCKHTSAQWLERPQHFDWAAYLAQYYDKSGRFFCVDEEPLLMKTRWFSFGFSDIFDENGSVITLPHDTNEIRARLSFDAHSDWKTFLVTAASGAPGPRKGAHTAFVAYPEDLAVENERIRDLRKQKRWLPRRYHGVNIYNLLEVEEEDDDEGHEDDDRDAEESSGDSN